jgi:hypothetical protein
LTFFRLFSLPGVNSRLDEVQAAILRTKLAYLDAAIERRRSLASRYSESLRGRGLRLPEEAVGARHAFHLYVVRTSERERLIAQLAARGVGTAVHYPVPVHRQPAYAARLRRGPLPVTDRVAGEVLSLPLYPELSHSEATAVIFLVFDVIDRASSWSRARASQSENAEIAPVVDHPLDEHLVEEPVARPPVKERDREVGLPDLEHERGEARASGRCRDVRNQLA